ncbi:MAG: hypothetical protein MUE51_07170 [Thermoleophilia bacterium]|jgi:hypothetical protein|nr:hypothetical protein [Thermoleophilia bacterium]
MRTAPLRRVLAAAAAVVTGALALAGPGPAGAAVSASALRCVGAEDAAGIDAILGEVGSPLAGEGATFVREARGAGLDPRFLVAVAAHETLLETYPPARAIRNPFGLGPGWRFDSEAEAIATAASTLRRLYLSENRVTIPDIGSKWAPLGADNDPGSLNQHWPNGVSAYFRALGGDPSRPVLLSAQAQAPACAPIGLAPVAAAAGPGVVTAWGGRVPSTGGPGMHQGGDPRTGLPATIAGFHFPLAPPAGVTVRYRDGFTDPGSGACYGRGWACRVTLQTQPGVIAVAAADGTLAAASAAEQRAGVAFWIERPGERVGYGGLATYSGAAYAGARVRAGQVLGRSTWRLDVAWSRSGMALNPYPLLSATRPPDA